MPISGYQKWAENYCTLFGLDRDSDLKMVAAWEGVFDSSGFTVAELTEATSSVAVNPPKWRADHLLAIQVAIRENRLRRWRAIQSEQDRAYEIAVCGQCAGTGWVIVPHPKCYDDGKWTEKSGSFYTATVTCHCPLGQRKIDAVLSISSAEREKKRIRLPLSLERYEQSFPQWHTEMRRHEELQKANHKARAVAAEFDKTYGPILKRLKGNT